MLKGSRLMLLLIVVLCCTSVGSAGVLFYDDFSGYPQDIDQQSTWITNIYETAAEWSIEDQVLIGRATSGAGAVAVTGSSQWKDYVLEAEFKFEKDAVRQYAAFLVRFSPPGTYHPIYGVGYVFSVSPWGVELHKVDPDWRKLSSVMYPAAPRLDVDAWHRVRVEVQGGSIKCYVNDRLLVDEWDGSFGEGMVGVRVVDHCTTYFRNVAVYSLDDDTQESEPEPGSSFSGQGSVVSFSEDNALLIDGEPVFPIGLYRMPASREMVSYGFNVTDISKYNQDRQLVKAVLDAAEEAGIKVLVHDDYAARRGHLTHLEETVLEFRDHPALLTWYVADEPQVYGIKPEDAQRLNDTIKQLDPYHPTYIVHNVPDLYAAYAPACDIMALDIYPIPDRPITVIAEGIMQARRVVEDQKPVWAIIQTHRNVNVPRRGPTPEELRAMTYLAVTHGAKGIYFFAYSSEEEGGRLEDTNPVLWRELVKLTKELQELSPVILSIGLDNPVVLENGLHYITTEYAGNLWVFVVNTTEKEVRMEIEMIVPDDVEAEIVHEGRSVRLVNGSLVDSFGPYDVRIYRIPLN